MNGPAVGAAGLEDSKRKKGGPISRVLCPFRGRRHPSRSAVARRFRATNPWIERAALHCSALLAARLAVPPSLPTARWALTPPFHPHRRALCARRFAVRSLSLANCPTDADAPKAVCFLWRYLSPANRLAPKALGDWRRPGSYPALRSREPGLSSADRPPAQRPAGVPRRRRGPPKIYSSESSMDESFSPSSESSSYPSSSPSSE